MTIYFSPADDREHGREQPQPHDDFLPPIPQDVLDRHRARVLNPADAWRAPGEPVPAPTVYRSDTMLVPNNLLTSGVFERVVNRTLAEIGLRLQPPEAVDADLGTLPRPVRLVPTATADQGDRPVIVDAWRAHQYLRARFRPQTAPNEAASVRRITLEHLMFGANDWFVGTPGAYGPSGVPTAAVSSTWGSGRIPVLVPGRPSARQDLDKETMPRRVVVAVLDTGIGVHEWLDVEERGKLPAEDAFVAVDPQIQNAIAQLRQATGDRHVIGDVWETPVQADTVIGEVDTHRGHGTFIAGIVRQVAPDAQVLAIRVMHSDGVAYEGDLVCALQELVKRVDRAQREPKLMVDVVSLSLGNYKEVPAGETDHVLEQIRLLVERGVVVCAAAGNDSTLRRFYPAAYAETLNGAGAGVISVGALNPNLTKALFSNDGRWVRCWAGGAALVSTFPVDVEGSMGPQNTMPAPAPAALPQRRTTLEPDDFSAGFAIWSGTSFAAPLAAADLAAALIESRCADGLPRLGEVDQASTQARVEAALKRVGPPD